jgi:enoyl-CoA hydratase
MLHLEQRDDVSVLALAHGKANALDLELCEGLSEALEDLHHARAVVLTGTGKIFCAGLDLRRLVGEGAPYVQSLLAALDHVLERLLLFPRPLVAALNGHAIAGGCVIACTADWRILARGGGRVGAPELRVGVPFPDLALEIVRAAVPPQCFREIVLRGENHEAARALELGLVDELVEPGAEVEKGLAVANELARISPRVYALNKRQIRRDLMQRLAARSARERDRVAKLWTEPAVLDAVERYVAQTLR